MQLNIYPGLFGGWTTEPPQELIGPLGASRQYDREVFLAGLAYRPERSTLTGKRGMRNSNDGLRANELTNIIRAQIEQGMNGADAVYTRVAELYKNGR